MKHQTIRAQLPTPTERPAVPTETAQPSQGRADRKKALAALTEAELQAVNGGGSKPGIGSGSDPGPRPSWRPK